MPSVSDENTGSEARDDAPFGALLQMTAKPGRRDEVLQILTHYARTLDGEPGTTLFAVSLDPNDDDMVWVWEEFTNGAAVQAHFAHDFFRALQMELSELLAEPAAVRPLAPVVRRVQEVVSEEPGD